MENILKSFASKILNLLKTYIRYTVHVEAQLTAPGNTTTRVANGYNTYLFDYNVATIDTNVVIRFEGSTIDNPSADADWFNLDSSGSDTTITSDGRDSAAFNLTKLENVRVKFVSELGGTAATIDVTILMSNS